MRRITFYVSTNRVGSTIKETVEFEDNVTEEEIEEYFQEWVWQNIDAGWYDEE